MEVAGREALEPERVEEARVVAEEDAATSRPTPIILYPWFESKIP